MGVGSLAHRLVYTPMYPTASHLKSKGAFFFLACLKDSLRGDSLGAGVLVLCACEQQLPDLRPAGHVHVFRVRAPRARPLAEVLVGGPLVRLRLRHEPTLSY
eukprot:1007378-Prorocentrum_minimum.AAC.1